MRSFRASRCCALCHALCAVRSSCRLADQRLSKLEHDLVAVLGACKTRVRALEEQLENERAHHETLAIAMDTMLDCTSLFFE